MERPQSIEELVSAFAKVLPGDNIICQVVAKEPGGYQTFTLEPSAKAFLETDIVLQIGDQIVAQFVDIRDARILLNSKTGAEAAALRNPHRLFMPINRLEFFPPAPHNVGVSNYSVRTRDELLEFISDLEINQQTCCIKTKCAERDSRTALLLYKGRAIGCAYENASGIELDSTDTALTMMLSDSANHPSEITMYEVPERIALPMAAFFLGYSGEPFADMDPSSHYEYTMHWAVKEQQTECLCFRRTAETDTLMLLIHEGTASGAFFVETQEYVKSLEDFSSKLESIYNRTHVIAYYFPPEHDYIYGLGFSLSAHMNYRDGK